MPNFDGAGPLKRGRVIGRGLEPCTQHNEGGHGKSRDAEPDTKEEHETN